MTTATNIREGFRQAIEQAGITPPDEIIADGVLHRFASNGDRADDAGWYIYFPDETPGGAFGCWRKNFKQTWSGKADSTLTVAERDRQRTRLDEARRQREQDEQLRHAEAAQRAHALWDSAAQAPPEHPYLQRKQVWPYGLRVDVHNQLVVPIYIDGAMTSLQFIPPDGQGKRFLYGGAVKGGSFVMGDLHHDVRTIVICEGVATGASIHEATGWPTVCSLYADNLKLVAEHLHHQFPTATIIIAGDHDEHGVGQEKAREAAEAVGGRVAIPDYVGCDWNDVALAQGLEAVRQLLDAALGSRVDASPPSSDSPPSPSASWPVLDDAALHGLAGEVVRIFSPHTEADDVAILVSFLSEVGTMVGRAPHLILDGSYHPLLIWPVIVGQSSKSRKGTADKRSRTICQLADPGWARGAYKGTPSSGEGVCFAVRDAEYRDEPVKERGRATGETVRICIDPGVVDKRLHLVVSEFGAMLRVMRREGNSLSGVLRDAYDGQDLIPMTKGSRVRATAPHIGLVGHVTRDELLRNLGDTEASNGFGNRFGWFAVRRSKELPFPSSPDSNDLHALALQIGMCLDGGRSMGQFELAPSAREAWQAIYHDLSADRPGLAGTLLGRAEAQVMRLSALYAVLDGTSQIAVIHLSAACALWTYAEQSVALLFGDSTGDVDADNILGALRQGGELTDTEISALFGYHRSRAQLDRAKLILQAAGLASCSSRETGGRPVRVWRPSPISTDRPGEV